MVWKSLLCAVSLLAVACGTAAGADMPVHVFTSELPPMAMSADKDRPGALHEMVDELSQRTSIAVSIQYVPWRRAVFLSTSSARTAIFPLTRSAERELQYRWLARLHHEHFLFLTLRNGRFNTADPVKSRLRRIGILRGSLMVPYLRQQGYPNVVEASSVDESLRFLQRGIVDAVFGDRDIIHALLKDGLADRYLMSKPLQARDTWLAGSRDVTEGEAALFHQAMKDMMKDGTHSRILRKYNLKAEP